MKFLTRLITALALLLMFGGNVYSQCTTSPFGAYPGPLVVPATNTPLVIATDAFAGEYTILTVQVGSMYTVTSSIATDYITITDGAVAPQTFGVQPHNFTAATATIRLYRHTNGPATCGTSNANRTITITCTSCPAPPTPPGNDLCAGAISLTPAGTCTPTSGNTVGATDNNEVGDCTIGTENSVWYSFMATATSHVVTVDGGAGFDPVVKAITTCGVNTSPTGGACVNLTGDDGIENLNLSGLTVGTVYKIQVHDFNGDNTAPSTFDICVTATPTAPNCATGLMPAGGTVALLCAPNPSSIVFTWTAPAAGAAPTGYKFYLGTGVPALLATVATTTITIINFLPSTSYSWYVVPTNGGGDAVGCAVPITFTTDVEPPCVVNNTCATATAIGAPGSPGSVSSTTTGATISRAGELCNGSTGNPDDDVWFSFTTDVDGGDLTLALTAAAVTLDAVVIAYSGTCGGLTTIGCADAGFDGGDETLNLLALAPNTTYYARVYGFFNFNSATPTSGAFTLTTSGTALPLELKSFTGQTQATTNVLYWETLTEKNVQSHIVERSVDGARWSEVGRKSGQGDSQVAVKYALEDRAPLAKAYYRLRSVDFDGKESLSSTIVLTRKGDQFGITSVYPSPTNGNVTVQFNATVEETVTVRVMDMTGRLVMQQVTEAVKDSNELPLTLTGLQAGVYTVTVASSTGVSAPVRFVKQ